MNASDQNVKCFIDEDFCKGSSIVGVHPNDNTETVWLKVFDLVELLRVNGTTVEFVELK